MNFKSRSDLWEQVTAALAGQSSIDALYVYGSQVRNQADEYSDIDLVLCANDLAGAETAVGQALTSVAEIVGTIHLLRRQDRFVQSVLLQGYSPYNKLDLAVTHSLDSEREFGPFSTVYKGNSPVSAKTSPAPAGDWDDFLNDIYGILFSVPRFTKCLFRRDRALYKRWVGLLERIWALLFERHFGWRQTYLAKISPPQHNRLQAALTDAEQRRLDSIIPPHGRLDLVASFRAGLSLLLQLAREKAAALDLFLDIKFAAFIEEFLRGEISRFQAQTV
ncbi:MAG: hypothetical protein GKR89_04995 [Candidatus Latescibacteria bacterium]|nr:hypothetical protein [Candidatus Latescibacterota bacterium]